MIIQVQPHQQAAVLEVDDLKSFKVVVVGPGTHEEVQAALGDLGRVPDDTHAWISIQELRSASGRDDVASWRSGFDGMVDYAASKGWVSDDGSELRAHIEHG
jgi:hypothetical protein